MIAPINAEYLASGPKVPTAWDSIAPGVSENKVCDAISGIKGPLSANLRTKATATAIAPVQRPTMNENLMEICFIIKPLKYLIQVRFKFFPDHSVSHWTFQVIIWIFKQAGQNASHQR